MTSVATGLGLGRGCFGREGVQWCTGSFPDAGGVDPAQNGGMSSVAAAPIDQRLQGMAAVIHQRLPGAEVRLFGSRARGTAGPESDIDLLITAPDAWLEGHHRFEVLNELWDQLAQADVSLDLLLYSQQECEERRHWRSHVIGRAYREGRLLDGAL